MPEKVCPRVLGQSLLAFYWLVEFDGFPSLALASYWRAISIFYAKL